MASHEQILSAPKNFKDSGYAQRRRAPRFKMTLPIAIQAADGTVVATSTQSVSARGLLLILDHELAAGSAVNFTMTLPPEVTMGTPTTVTGEGHVLRSVHAPTAEALWHVTITVDRYKFLETSERKSAAPHRRRSA